MALRKEEFEEDASWKRQRMTHEHIDLNVSGELLRRITRAAQQKSISIDEYLEHILEEAVPDEASLASRRHPITPEIFEQVMRVHQEIKNHTKGYVFEDSTDLIRQMREERSQELDRL